MNINFTNTDPALSFSSDLDVPTGPPPTYMSSGGNSESVLNSKPSKTETIVFPDSSYISPKVTTKSPENPPPLKRSKSVSIPDSSFISPKEASKSLHDPPTLKRCRAIAPNFNEEKSSKKSKNEEENSDDADDENDDEDYEDDEDDDEDGDGKTLEYVDDDEKAKNFTSKSVSKIKIPSDFNPDIPKNVINFLRNLNKREFNFIMSRGYILKAGDLHNKKIKKVVLELRNYYGIIVAKKK